MAEGAGDELPDVVDKQGLAERLDWSRPRLDRRLSSDPAFPVLQHGGQGGGWRFSIAAVEAYLGFAAGSADAGDEASAPFNPDPGEDPISALLRRVLRDAPGLIARRVGVPTTAAPAIRDELVHALVTAAAEYALALTFDRPVPSAGPRQAEKGR